MQLPLEIKTSICSPSQLALRCQQNAQIEAATNAEKQLDDYPSAADYRAALAAARPRWYNPAARILEIPSSYGSHAIQLRCIAPAQGAPRGVLLHFHGGGFVIGSNSMCDRLLTTLADEGQLVVVSVEYRLAPEHPWPAAGEDCLDAAIYALSDEGALALGGRLRFISGESAGSFLTVWTTLSLRDKGVDVNNKLDGLICQYGIYDLTFTPSVRLHERNIFLGRESTTRFIDTAFPSDLRVRKDGIMSPLYAHLEGLPSSLFLVGSVDPLYDDTVFMATRWASAGNKTTLKIVAEAFHGFTLLPCDANKEGVEDVLAFIEFETK